MRKFFYISAFLFFNVIVLEAQDLDIKQQQNLRKHAEGNITDLENTLNLIINSNNPEEKKRLIEQAEISIIDIGANIVNDLDPNKSDSTSTDYKIVDDYLNTFQLILIPDTVEKPIVFSNIYIGKVSTGDYTFVNVYFEELFNGIHKVTNKRYSKVSRMATIKSFPENGKMSTKIVSIKFSNSSELINIKTESESFEKEYSDFQEIQLQSEKLAEQRYNELIKEAEKAFVAEQYDEALESFRSALNIKSNDLYATTRKNEIEKIKYEQKIEETFNSNLFEGDLSFSNKKYSVAKSYYEAALKIKPTSEKTVFINNQLTKINRLLNIKYPHSSTAYLGINYNLYKTNSSNNISSNSSGGFQKSFDIENLGISFYYPVGLYFSGLKLFKGTEPDYYYPIEKANEVKSELENSHISFTDLTFHKTESRIAGFNTGMYFSFFRPIYLKVGFSYYFGSEWDLYSGDLKYSINYSRSNSDFYALNYREIQNINLQVGIAFTFPYVQLETTYDKLSQSFLISAGLNIPIKKVYFLKNNPNRNLGYKKYPHKSTVYFGLSYNLINYSFDEKKSIEEMTYNIFQGQPKPKLTFSFYGKAGLFFGFNLSPNKSNPDYHYNFSQLESARNSLLISGTNYTELEVKKITSNISGYNGGVSFMLYHALHMKLGFSYIKGFEWSVYEGNYKYALKKYNNTDYYAVNFNQIERTSVLFGFAFVFPFFQSELVYDNALKSFILSAGLNIPVKVN